MQGDEMEARLLKHNSKLFEQDKVNLKAIALGQAGSVLKSILHACNDDETLLV